MISQLFTLEIPEDLAPGTYALHIGLYDYVTGKRLTVEDANGGQADSRILFTVEVAAP